MNGLQTGKGWEYKVVQLGPSSSMQSEDLLNELGKERWELVTFQPTGERAYPGEGTYYLKRVALKGAQP